MYRSCEMKHYWLRKNVSESGKYVIVRIDGKNGIYMSEIMSKILVWLY